MGAPFGLLLIAGGVALLAYGLSTGRISVALPVIVPVFYGSFPELLLSALLIMGGLVLLFFAGTRRDNGTAGGMPDETARPSSSPETSKRETKARARPTIGGVVILGPIPIVWGSDRRIALVALLLALLLMVVLAFYRPFGG